MRHTFATEEEAFTHLCDSGIRPITLGDRTQMPPEEYWFFHDRYVKATLKVWRDYTTLTALSEFRNRYRKWYDNRPGEGSNENS